MADEREPISVVPSRKIRARETAVRKLGAATIRIIKGEIARMVDEAESALIEALLTYEPGCADGH